MPAISPRRIYTVEISLFDEGGEIMAATARTAYYSTGKGFVTAPSDAPSNTVFEPRVKQPALVRLDMFAPGRTTGVNRVGFGELVLNNADGGLDAFLNYGFDGRDIRVYVGDEGAAYPSGFTLVMRGTMEQPEVTNTEVRIKVRDRQFLADIAIQTTRYAGSNSLPNGVEGTTADIVGQTKPKLYGAVQNVRPIRVNTTRQIFQFNDGLADVTAVYDSAVGTLTRGADYTSQANMEAAAPSAGQYRVWPAGGMFRLGSAPTGDITCDPFEGATAADRTAAQVAYRMLTGPGGISSGEISASDITALDAANPSEVGIYVTSLRANETSDLAPWLTRVLGSVGAGWFPDRSGTFRFQRLEAPTGTELFTLQNIDLFKIERLSTQDEGSGVPAWRVAVLCNRNWTVQSSDFAPAVTEARRAFLSRESAEAIAEDVTVKTKHLLAPEMAFSTDLLNYADGVTEAARLLALYQTRRDRFEVIAALDDARLALLELNGVVKMIYPRYGLQDGKLFRVLGYRIDARRNRVEITLWG